MKPAPLNDWIKRTKLLLGYQFFQVPPLKDRFTTAKQEKHAPSDCKHKRAYPHTKVNYRGPINEPSLGLVGFKCPDCGGYQKYLKGAGLHEQPWQESEHSSTILTPVARSSR